MTANCAAKYGGRLHRAEYGWPGMEAETNRRTTGENGSTNQQDDEAMCMEIFWCNDILMTGYAICLYTLTAVNILIYSIYLTFL